MEKLMRVFCLIEETGDTPASVLGVYRSHDEALLAKYDLIREFFDIPEEEVANKDLDSETEHYWHIAETEMLEGNHP
jgi:hypothetical protein